VDGEEKLYPSHIFSFDCNMSLKRYDRGESSNTAGSATFLSEDEVNKFDPPAASDSHAPPKKVAKKSAKNTAATDETEVGVPLLVGN
jgi:hypothetical protein